MAINNRPMFDKRMLDRLSGFFPSLVTIYSNAKTIDSMGSPEDDWEPIEDLTMIPAAVAPFNDIIPISGERKLENLSYDTATKRITLKGYYPEITPKMHLKVEGDNQDFNILGVEVDSHLRTTRVICNEVTI